MEDNKETEEKKPPLQNYMNYSGASFQLIFLVLLGVWGGKELDAYFGLQKPILLVVCTLLALALGMYSGFRQIMKK